MQFEKNIISLYGQQGSEWLESIPNLVAQFTDRWSLSDLQVFPDLSYNYVISCFQNENAVVLKIGFCKGELQAEANALRVFAGRGCIKLIDSDIELGAILLQRVVPGTSLKNLFPNQEEQAVKITSRVIKNLQCAPLPNAVQFPNVADWAATLNRNWNLQQKHLVKARNLSKKLLSTSTKQVLLHGDLHHENILLSGQGNWIAIDPKGVIGDPVYEIGAFIRNPIPELLKNDNAKNIIQHRINLFADFLGYDYKRISDWAYVQAALSACWSLEYGFDAAYFVEFLEMFE